MLVFKVERLEGGVGFLWTPAHVGVEWRETPDGAARLSVGGAGVEAEVDTESKGRKRHNTAPTPERHQADKTETGTVWPC